MLMISEVVVPHLTIHYSTNVDAQMDMQALCSALGRVLAESGIFPLGGIRVRAVACNAYAVADEQPQNAFADMVLRIAAGRSAEDRHATGVALMRCAEQHFASLLAEPFFALSLEIVEITAAFSWKTNSIHARLAAANAS
jgi:5-carboxymethyl-2-hydroxymuconate isomerase